MGFPAGCYWYGNKKQGPGHLPRWLKALCEEQISEARSEQCSSQIVRSSKKNQSTESTIEGSASKNTSVKTKKTRTREIVPPASYRNQLGVLMMKRGSDVTRLNRLLVYQIH